MNARLLRFFLSVIALMATVTVSTAPLIAGEQLCMKCIHDCPDDDDEDVVCNALCNGDNDDAVCDEDDYCDSTPSSPNLIVCQQGPQQD
jgi:hypothetical protein